MFYPNGTKFTEEVPYTQGRPHSKFKEDSFSHSRDTSNQTFKKFLCFCSCSFYYSFCTLCKNHYNLCMRASIWLKFGTHIGYLKANTSVKFGVNLMNIQGVISNFTHKTKLNFCYAYRVNHFEKKAENRYVARLSIREVPFSG